MGIRMKPSGVGGMAVMEGVMMKNKAEYAVAVRKPNKEIVIEKGTYNDFSDKVKLFKLPIFRGMLAFVDSMVIGVKVLNFSSSFFEEEEESQTKKKKENSNDRKNKKKNYDDDFEIDEVSATKVDEDDQKSTLCQEDQKKEKKQTDKSNAILMALAVIISIIMSVGLFMVLPVLITNLFSTFVTNHYMLAFIEGILRLTIFIGYVILAAKMPEIKRVFMYHGAEHKTINCLENGFELTVENVRWQSKQHKRCGTSFMLLVIIISLIFFIAIPVEGIALRVISRILFIPFIAGISYEFIRYAGQSDNKFVNILSKPGLLMQGLTTKEPDDSMIEVAIQSVGAVFDCKSFLEASVKEEKKANSKTKNKTNNKTNDKTNDKTNNKINSNANNKLNSKTNSKPVEKNANSKTANVNKPETVLKATEILKETEQQKEEIAKTIRSEKDDSATRTATHTSTHTSTLISSHTTTGKRNHGTEPIHFKTAAPDKTEEEDDEILRALDKFFDDNHKEGKSGEHK